MMMPIIDQTPVHHLHGHGHQSFYHQQHIPEQSGKMQLTLILPTGVPSVISVEANTPMMDLLVQATSLNKLNPSSYSLVVLDSNQHIIHFKPNQTVGQIVRNCQLPQINGSSTISLLPKETSHPPNHSSKPKTQPFEITVRLQVNLPDGQKILLRVDPTLPLHEIKEQICKQKKYTDSNRYTLRLPNKIDKPLLLGLSLAEYKTNELSLVHLKHEPSYSKNQLQSFDRLYRTRSESQPPKETIQEIQNEQEEVNNSKQRPASVQLNSKGSPIQNLNITSLPAHSTHKITSHTSLHAYWNDPNFDTQSQTSNNSSTTKKRRAPKPPGYISPNLSEQQIILSQLSDQCQSHESLTESTKQKRKAPILSNTIVSQENDDQQIKTTSESEIFDPTTNTIHEENLESCASEKQQIPLTTKLSVNIDSHDENISETHSPTPIYSQVQKTKEFTSTEPPYSTVQVTSISPKTHQEEEMIHTQSPTNYSLNEIVQAGIAEPPKMSPKKSTINNGLLKIINDHHERADVYQKNEKESENVSYFRVAKSRHGKFETENQGFVNTSTNVFDVTNNKNQEKSTSIVTHDKPINEKGQNQQLKIIDTNDFTTRTNDKEKSPTPIQLEVTERTTHISVTVESDRKQLITRASPVQQQTTVSPSILAPKPFGKTITEYRTVKRIGQDGETTTKTTVRTEKLPSPTSTDNTDQAASKSTTHDESHMESIRPSGDLEDSSKK